MVTIKVPEDSEIARVLRDAPDGGEPLRIRVGHTTYVVRRANDEPWLVDNPDEIRSDYDPERVREALQKSAGAFRGIDRDRLLADLREQREQDSTGRPA